MLQNRDCFFEGWEEERDWSVFLLTREDNEKRGKAEEKQPKFFSKHVICDCEGVTCADI